MSLVAKLHFLVFQIQKFRIQIPLSYASINFIIIILKKASHIFSI